MYGVRETKTYNNIPDHRAIHMSVKTENTDRGPGYWKFNTSLLCKPDFLNFMNEALDKIIENASNMEPFCGWEYIKKQIAKRTQNYARNNAKERTIAISQLMEKVDEMQSSFPLDVNQTELYDRTVSDLETLQQEYIYGVIFRSKANWYFEGEKCTKYFLNLEKNRYCSKTCNALIIGDEIVVDQAKIMQEQVRFYTELYSSDQKIKFNIRLENCKTVSKETRIEQNTEFCETDIAIAIKSMNNNKTPGSDGIGVDFYKVFWNKLQIPYTNLVRYCF